MSPPLLLPPPLAFASSSSSGEQQPLQYSLNSKVMVAATLILCIVVVFVVSLHVYAKWFWRRGRRATSAAGGARWRLHGRHLAAEFTDVLSTPAPPALTGLDPATIDSLPTFTHQAPLPKPRDAAAAAAPLLECAVCLSEFQSLEKGRLLPDCKHRFHVSCIDAWLRAHSTCPLCRVPVSPPRQFEHSTCALPIYPIPSPPTPFSLLPARQHDRLAMAQSFCPVAANLRSHERPSAGLALSVAGAHLQEHHRPQTSAAMDRRAEAQASSKSMADGFCESSSSEKSGSQFQQEGAGASIARCHSLGAPCRPLEDAESYALQPAKSRSFHKSIKWLISRELSRGKGRIFPSGGEGTEQEEHQEVGQRSSSRGTDLPV